MSNNWGGKRAGSGRKSFAEIHKCRELLRKAVADDDWIEGFANLMDTWKSQGDDGSPVNPRQSIEAAKLLLRYAFGIPAPEPPKEEEEIKPIRIMEIMPSCMRDAKKCPYANDPAVIYDGHTHLPIQPDDPDYGHLFEPLEPESVPPLPTPGADPSPHPIAQQLPLCHNTEDETALPARPGDTPSTGVPSRSTNLPRLAGAPGRAQKPVRPRRTPPGQRSPEEIEAMLDETAHMGQNAQRTQS